MILALRKEELPVSSNAIFDILSFQRQVQTCGFANFWNQFIQTYVNKLRPDLEITPSNLDINITNECFSLDNIGELYEIALECTNKISKKELGQYFTPQDTADFMARKLRGLLSADDNIADVCCGTGNLIIALLKQMPGEQALNLILNRKIWLYDLDEYAMKLAVMKLAILFVPKGDTDTYNNFSSYINCVTGNFLCDTIMLPGNCAVISNPPYGKLPHGTSLWFDCETYATNEMFAVFMEKIAKQSKVSVIISPQSFLGSAKFSTLRRVLAKFGGKVYAFDNVPASIFNGKKHGIFNTNSANSVRAAITVIDNKNKGFRTTPLIRFKNCERDVLFCSLDKFVGNVVYNNATAWLKVPKPLEVLVKRLNDSKCRVSDLISSTPNAYKLTVPSTPRYFVTASAKDLNRGGAIEIYARDQEAFDRLYVLLNSTISYLWWRICDGGITITKDTLLNIPVPDIRADLAAIVQEGKNLENSCIKIKVNAGKSNENVKFPDAYRKRLNKCMLDVLDNVDTEIALYALHGNALELVLESWT